MNSLTVISLSVFVLAACAELWLALFERPSHAPPDTWDEPYRRAKELDARTAAAMWPPRGGSGVEPPRAPKPVLDDCGYCGRPVNLCGCGARVPIAKRRPALAAEPRRRDDGDDGVVAAAVFAAFSSDAGCSSGDSGGDSSGGGCD